MKVRQGVAIALSGITWMGIGILLLTKGFSLVLTPLSLSAGALFLPKLSSLVGSARQASLLLVCVAIFIGFLKGRLVLRKSADRIISRILSLPNPCSFFSIYPRSYLILLGSMMGLGMALKWIPIPYDLKGFIDIAVGSALTNGSAFYFRQLTASSGAKK
jgi:hypothetical protein